MVKARLAQTLGIATVALVAAWATFMPAPAEARVHVGIGIGIPLYAPAYPAPAYYYPPPVYYAPPPPAYYAPPPAAYAPPPAYAPAPTAATGQQCREYSSTQIIGGQPQQLVGTACLQPDGSWRIMD